ncbi:MAG: exodeoxyribonuclease VII large subunit [Chloroflexota bacterium]|nr:exodeoxyribonuclease VII large subunit [Chloroflexota bacterium]
MFTVTELVTHIKQCLESDPVLGHVRLEGEVSNFRQAPSGHCYFTLKDDAAVIPCVMWKNAAMRLVRLPLDGEMVSTRGRVSLYQAQGRVQFYVDHLEPMGVGQLYQELEALKDRLEQEGLFDEARKQPLPSLPGRVGIVTSSRAAALQDILRTLAVRFPLTEVILSPATVQGVDAPAQIASAIELLNFWHLVTPIDVIIVARGGGSIEELWAFNDEKVVRAIANSAIPVVSGVGHETDVTLADFSADFRAATPTGAAVLAVPDRQELSEQVRAIEAILANTAGELLGEDRSQLGQLKQRLLRASPQAHVASRRQRVDELTGTMAHLVRHQLALRQSQLKGRESQLAGLNPHAVLARGFAIVQRKDNLELITSVDQVRTGDRLDITVQDGTFESNVGNEE